MSAAFVQELTRARRRTVNLGAAAGSSGNTDGMTQETVNYARYTVVLTHPPGMREDETVRTHTRATRFSCIACEKDEPRARGRLGRADGRQLGQILCSS